jgi:hypothetical protein
MFAPVLTSLSEVANQSTLKDRAPGSEKVTEELED